MGKNDHSHVRRVTHVGHVGRGSRGSRWSWVTSLIANDPLSALMLQHSCWSSSKLTGRRWGAVGWNSRYRRMYELDYENKINSQQTENLKQFTQHYYIVKHQPSM